MSINIDYVETQETPRLSNSYGFEFNVYFIWNND